MPKKVRSILDSQVHWRHVCMCFYNGILIDTICGKCSFCRSFKHNKLCADQWEPDFFNAYPPTWGPTGRCQSTISSNPFSHAQELLNDWKFLFFPERGLDPCKGCSFHGEMFNDFRFCLFCGNLRLKLKGSDVGTKPFILLKKWLLNGNVSIPSILLLIGSSVLVPITTMHVEALVLQLI